MPGFRRGNRLLPFLLFLIGLLIWMTIQVRSGSQTDVVASPVASVQRFLTSVTNSIHDIWKHYVNLSDTERENQRLRGRLNDAEVRLALLEEVQRENERLRSLLNMSAPGESTLFAFAHVVSWDPAGWAQVALIDRGSNDGVVRDMPVVTPKGLLGRIVQVSPKTSRLLLVSDTRSAVAVRLQGSRANAILEGTGRRSARLLYVQRETPVATGELVVTSGLDGMFPSGIPVGMVMARREEATGIFQEIAVVPLADVDSVEEVALLNPASGEP